MSLAPPLEYAEVADAVETVRVGWTIVLPLLGGRRIGGLAVEVGGAALA